MSYSLNDRGKLVVPAGLEPAITPTKGYRLGICRDIHFHYGTVGNHGGVRTHGLLRVMEVLHRLSYVITARGRPT